MPNHIRIYFCKNASFIHTLWTLTSTVVNIYVHSYGHLCFYIKKNALPAIRSPHHLATKGVEEVMIEAFHHTQTLVGFSDA